MPVIIDNSVFLAWCMGDEEEPAADVAMQRVADEGGVGPAHLVVRSSQCAIDERAAQQNFNAAGLRHLGGQPCVGSSDRRLTRRRSGLKSCPRIKLDCVRFGLSRGSLAAPDASCNARPPYESSGTGNRDRDGVGSSLILSIVRSGLP